MLQPGRNVSAANYRYGFNGKEQDNDVKGIGNQVDYGLRIYDSRVGRFLSVDPLTKSYPMLTPYQYASNRPIDGIDLDGLEYTPAGFTKYGPRESTSVKLYPANPVIILQISVKATAQLRYQNEWIAAPDILGNGHIGPRYVVQSNIAIIKQNYNNNIAENIAGGPFGAAGYLIDGDRGSFVGTAVDQIVYSFGGFDKSGYLAKARVNVTSEVPANVNEIFYEKYKAERPRLLQKTINKVWENAKDADGNVYDPNTGELLTWDKFKSRYDQWHMGHKTGYEYSKLLLELKNGKITEEQFKKEYNNPDNYQPESPSANMSHKFEDKQQVQKEKK